jgi:hypothetical protein
MSSGGALARVDVTNDDNVNVSLLFAHSDVSVDGWK